MAQKTHLTPICFVEVSVPSQESERSCICQLVILLLHPFPFYDFYIRFWNCFDVVVFFFISCYHSV